MTQVEYLQACIRQANALLKTLGYAMHWDETFIPEENYQPQVQTSGPQCKKCGAFTTYKRVESHGMCMKCEHD